MSLLQTPVPVIISCGRCGRWGGDVSDEIRNGAALKLERVRPAAGDEGGREAAEEGEGGLHRGELCGSVLRYLILPVILGVLIGFKARTVLVIPGLLVEVDVDPRRSCDNYVSLT